MFKFFGWTGSWNIWYQRFPSEIDVLQFAKFIDLIELMDVKSIASLFHFLEWAFSQKMKNLKILGGNLRMTYLSWIKNSFGLKLKIWKTVTTKSFLCEFILILLHSSASCICIFSLVTINKTDTCNKMESP